MSKYLRFYASIFFSILLGLGTGFSNVALAITTATVISTLFLNFLSMIAAPLVFLSIFSTLLNMQGLDQMKRLGKRVLFYTFVTTTLASLVALGFFLLLDPVSAVQKSAEHIVGVQQLSYLQFIEEIIPSNLVKAFAENKVISLVFLGFLLGITAHFLADEQRDTLRKGFFTLFHLFLKIAGLITYLMPIAIWAFMTLLVQDLKNQDGATSGLWIYLMSIIFANLAQGVLVIPLLLKLRGLSPWTIAKGGMKAILMAFFTKSSNATLPVSLSVAEKELGIRPAVAQFTLPLCTVINMNGCAAFILTTVLFVSGIHGHTFSPIDLLIWVFLSVLAAVGNAGVPMGCFFLSSAFLMSMDVPLTTMGLILPFYTLIDMEETALNVWSDLSVVSLVNQDCKQDEEHGLLST